MDFKVHLDLVCMIFTDSYIGAVHLGKMDFLVHLGKMDFLVHLAKMDFCQNAPNICYTNVSWVIWYRLHT
jgi:hypothetical protein